MGLALPVPTVPNLAWLYDTGPERNEVKVQSVTDKDEAAGRVRGGCRLRSAREASPRPAPPCLRGSGAGALWGPRDAADPPAPLRPRREAGGPEAVTDSRTCPWTVSGVFSSLWFLLFHYYDSDWVGSGDDIV